MEKFLEEILKKSENTVNVFKDYESFDGYKVLNCPYLTFKENVLFEERFIIDSDVLYRVLQIVDEMRLEGIKERVYSN